MKSSYIITTLLGLSLVTGCINIRVCDCKPKHHEEKESGERDEEKDEHEGKRGDHEKEEAEEKDKKDSKAKLQAMAKLTESQARQIALSKVPHGIIKEGELEKENGKLQWSFDIATPDTKDITEVNIDAITGKIIDISKESPSDQAKEQAAEKKEKEEKEKD